MSAAPRLRPAGPARRRALRSAAYAGAGVGGVALLTGGAVGAAAAYFTRRLVTPVAVKPDDVEVLEVGDDTVTLAVGPETVAPGRYGLWLDGTAGHARLGGVVRRDRDRVVRRLHGVDRGVLRPGPARWNQYYFAGPPAQSLGLAHEDVEVAASLGPMPGWLVRPADGRVQGRVWGVLVHGRGATREECLRAVPLLHALDVPVLVPSYRNDAGAPPAPGGRYHLGDTEWEDVEAAVSYALDHGASDVVLFGWSMGGAVVLQVLARSWLADRVRGVVLDAPVVDWHDVVDHHARLNRLPTRVARLGHTLLRHPTLRRLVGVASPVDLRRLDWVSRAEEMRLPMLLVHSDDDEFVPNEPSRRLAAARPDLVRLLRWSGSRHCKEWNVDPQRWEREVTSYVAPLLTGP